MHKTVTITIGGQLFHVEEEAYATLDPYLASIHAHFASYPEDEEIVEDIETRIAEDFSGKLNARKKVITLKDVHEVTKRMGTVKDFEEFDAANVPSSNESTNNESPSNKKWGRLYRDADDQMIAGVCAGIAKFFNVDPTIIRLLFAVTIFMGGTGVILYILLWVILPEAKTTAEKVEMSQGKVTLNAIRERVEAAMPPADERRSTLRKIVSFPVVVIGAILRGIAKFFGVLFPIVGRIIGGIVTIGGAFGIAMATLVLLMLLLNPSSPYIDLPMKEIVGGTNYMLLLFAAYFLAFIPVLFVLLIGVCLLTMRNVFTAWSVAAMIGIWMIALIAGGVTGFSVAPQVEAYVEKYEAENSVIVTRTLELENFTKIVAGGSARIEVVQGDSFSVIMEGPERELNEVQALVDGDTLEISRKPRKNNCVFLCSRKRIIARVTLPKLDGAQFGGAVEGSIRGFAGIPMMIEANGAAQIEADVQPTTLTLIGNGAANVELTGTADHMDIELNGAASLGAYTFIAKNATVDFSGASRAMLDVRESLTGELSGASHLYYEQRPAVLEVQEYDAAKLEQRDEDFRARW